MSESKTPRSFCHRPRIVRLSIAYDCIEVQLNTDNEKDIILWLYEEMELYGTYIMEDPNIDTANEIIEFLKTKKKYLFSDSIGMPMKTWGNFVFNQ